MCQDAAKQWPEILAQEFYGGIEVLPEIARLPQLYPFLCIHGSLDSRISFTDIIDPFHQAGTVFLFFEAEKMESADNIADGIDQRSAKGTGNYYNDIYDGSFLDLFRC